jgi:hypothetical protein
VSGTYYSDLIFKTTEPKKAMRLIDSLAHREINQINQLPWKVDFEGKTLRDEEEIREFLTSEVHAFYSAIFLNGMFLKRVEQVTRMIKDSATNPNIGDL